MKPEYYWVNTPGYNEQRIAGRPLHAVRDGEERSACGIKRKQWVVDLQNDTRCKQCSRRVEQESRS